MCLFCNSIRAQVPPHRTENCRDPRNHQSTHPTAVAGRQAAAAAAAAPGSFLWQIKTLSGKHNINPRNVDASRGAQIWDGSVWWSFWQVQRFGNTVRVLWVDGPMGTPEKFHDFDI